MTVTSPPAGWSGTSWTGGLAQGCAPTFKTSASVNDLPTSGVDYFFRSLFFILQFYFVFITNQLGLRAIAILSNPI